MKINVHATVDKIMKREVCENDKDTIVDQVPRGEKGVR